MPRKRVTIEVEEPKVLAALVYGLQVGSLRRMARESGLSHPTLIALMSGRQHTLRVLTWERLFNYFVQEHRRLRRARAAPEYKSLVRAVLDGKAVRDLRAMNEAAARYRSAAEYGLILSEFARFSATAMRWPNLTRTERKVIREAAASGAKTVAVTSARPQHSQASRPASRVAATR